MTQPTRPGGHETSLEAAIALMQQGAWAAAESAYRKIIAVDPGQVDALHLLGLALAQQGRLDEAAVQIRAAIGVRDDLPALHSNLGNVQKLLGRLDDALASYERALLLQPDHVEARSNRGNVLRDLGRETEALAEYDAAIALAPAFADAHYNRGVVLHGLNRFADAVGAYRMAISHAPSHANAHNNLGLALQALDRRAEALAAFGRAAQLQPDFVEARLHEAFCRLGDGDFAQGWLLYEDRRRLPGFRMPAGRTADRQWRGLLPKSGTTVLLWAEQGLGDTIQFCRYAQVIAGSGAKVIIEVQPALKSLLQGMAGGVTVVAQGEPVPAFDFHCPLLTAPMMAGTDFSNMPAAVPYIHADPLRVERFSATLGARQRPRIGVVWSGSPNPYNRNDHRRSVPLELFRELFHPDAQWVSLQKELRSADAPLFAQSGVVDMRQQLADFSDTAALIELMDLVISIDTSVAHLAAAMGKPLWILLPHQADWRWFLERTDSPWYPTARLFRQTSAGEWTDVLARVSAELQVLHKPRSGMN